MKIRKFSVSIKKIHINQANASLKKGTGMISGKIKIDQRQYYWIIPPGSKQ